MTHIIKLYTLVILLKPDESSATNRIPKHQVHCTMHRIPHQRRKVLIFPALSPTIFSTIEPFPNFPSLSRSFCQNKGWAGWAQPVDILRKAAAGEGKEPENLSFEPKLVFVYLSICVFMCLCICVFVYLCSWVFVYLCVCVFVFWSIWVFEERRSSSHRSKKLASKRWSFKLESFKARI